MVNHVVERAIDTDCLPVRLGKLIQPQRFRKLPVGMLLLTVDRKIVTEQT